MDLFPYDEVRPEQDKLMAAVAAAVESGGQLVAHAPTGLGKTAASLAPALAYAREHGKTVVFVTPRLTQHKLALETLGLIKEKHKIPLKAIDVIGKKWFCLQPGAERLGREFYEYCRALRNDKQCEFYEALRKGEELSPATKALVKELAANGPRTTKQVMELASQAGLCPYEATLLVAREADVIIADYSYLFNPGIADTFLAKIGKELSDLIIIVDEAHNLPDRTKDAASERVSTFSISRAISEAEKYEYSVLKKRLEELLEVTRRMGLTISEEMTERYIDKEDLVRRIDDASGLADALIAAGDHVREEEQQSSLGAVGTFLRTWIDGEDEGFTRILSENEFKGEQLHRFLYRCLDPSVVTGPVLNGAHAAIMMSGTLSPTKMYKELLGVLKAEELSLDSPFPQDNRLTIVIPKTSTRYRSRSDEMYREIAGHCAKVIAAVPGNSALFFPSYQLLSDVLRHLQRLTSKRLLAERQGMSKEEKHDFLETFKSTKEEGAALLGVISGNFGEGIDLPGDELRCVVVVGIPLQRPDLETKALIDHFDNKFGRGWEYGYLYPAFNRTLQGAGRCIRSASDRGALVFLDERYADQYKSYFPEDWDLLVTVLYEKQILDFFEQERKDKKLTDFG